VIDGFQNVFKIPELKKRILYTLALLAVYRIGVFIPVPGIDGQALTRFFESMQGTILGFFNMFSGGALEQMAVFALGIMPYISASIIMELLTVVVPHLERLKKEGEQGRKKITQYSRYGTVLLSMVQGLGIAIGLENMDVGGASVVPVGGWGFRLMTMLTLTAGTTFIMWLGEQITERGIGNGISLIIFAGIVAGIPSAIGATWTQLRLGEMSPFLILGLLIIMVGVVAAIVFMEAADSDPIRQTCGREADVWWTEHTLTAEDQHFRGDSANLCVVSDGVSRYHCTVCRWSRPERHLANDRAAALAGHHFVFGANGGVDHFLCLFLYGDHFQSD
jgi:preprotein translocase subunit SecY